MFKMVLSMTLLLAGLSVSAFAAIPLDQMHIGGLKPGMTLQQLASVYGMPVADTSGFKGAKGMYHIAGGLISGWLEEDTNTFAEYCINREKAGSERIPCSGNICLGMTEGEVLNRLGRPDKIMKSGTGTFYAYYSVEKGRSWRGHDALLLRFNDGKLAGITINVY